MTPAAPGGRPSCAPSAPAATAGRGQNRGSDAWALTISTASCFVATAGGDCYADEELIGDIYERAVVLKLPASAAAQLPPPTPAPAAMRVGVDEVSESPGAYKRDIWFKRIWNRLSGKY